MVALIIYKLSGQPFFVTLYNLTFKVKNTNMTYCHMTVCHIVRKERKNAETNIF